MNLTAIFKIRPAASSVAIAEIPQLPITKGNFPDFSRLIGKAMAIPQIGAVSAVPDQIGNSGKELPDASGNSLPDIAPALPGASPAIEIAVASTEAPAEILPHPPQADNVPPATDPDAAAGAPPLTGAAHPAPVAVDAAVDSPLAVPMAVPVGLVLGLEAQARPAQPTDQANRPGLPVTPDPAAPVRAPILPRTVPQAQPQSLQGTVKLGNGDLPVASQPLPTASQPLPTASPPLPMASPGILAALAMPVMRKDLLAAETTPITAASASLTMQTAAAPEPEMPATAALPGRLEDAAKALLASRIQKSDLQGEGGATVEKSQVSQPASPKSDPGQPSLSPQTFSATVLQAPPSALAPSSLAPPASAAQNPSDPVQATALRHDFEAVVEKLTTARQSARPGHAEMTLQHREFGNVSVQFDQAGASLKVGMTSSDPDFVASAQAALAERPFASPADGSRSDQPPVRPEMTASQSSGGNPGQSAADAQRGDQQARTAPQRPAADHRNAQGGSTEQETTGSRRDTRRGLFA